MAGLEQTAAIRYKMLLPSALLPGQAKKTEQPSLPTLEGSGSAAGDALFSCSAKPLFWFFFWWWRDLTTTASWSVSWVGVADHRVSG
jgi:hypothetical protein